MIKPTYTYGALTIELSLEERELRRHIKKRLPKRPHPSGALEIFREEAPTTKGIAGEHQNQISEKRFWKTLMMCPEKQGEGSLKMFGNH